MQVKLFTIPLFDNETELNEMNGFLRAQKVLTIDKQFVSVGENAYWSFCVTYLQLSKQSTMAQNAQRQNKIDYKEVLDVATFAVFSTLRTIRKQIAENEAVPAYAVFTDSELAEIAKLENIDVAHLQSIQGIGQKKAEKYGQVLCEQYRLQMGLAEE
ncbi:MAG: HRDC domain-containing protein [Paludibacteraceae bacterium]|nr:HRDC domain-containing protein [Paludibacteraceae bacterium]